MIVRAAAGGMAGSFANDANMLSFKEQLDSLGMTSAISELLGGGNRYEKVEPSVLEDPVKAKRIAKEQSNALKREQDHRKMVESALEKLRKEREERARDRNKLAAAALRRREEKGQPAGHHRHNDGPNKPAALRQPAQRRGRSHDPDPRAQLQQEKAKRVSEARENQEAQRRRHEAQLAQQRRDAEERREREQERERARQREDMLAREKREQAKAQEEAIARREAQRQRERGRQLAEIDQLKKDKLELDRRSQERERIREERRRNERARLEEARVAHGEDKLMSPDVEKLNLNGRGIPLSEEKEISAKDRVLQRKQEKQAKEEAERIAALRQAEIENRRIRAQASSQAQSQYHNAPAPTSARQEEDTSAQSKDQGGGLDELTARLHQARGRGPRYEEANRDAGDKYGDAPLDYGEDDTDSENEDEASCEFGAGDVHDEQSEREEQEDMIRREEELQAELNLATRRCQELKETLQVTKSFLGKGPTLAKGKDGTKLVDAIQSDDEESDEESDDIPEEYDEDEDNSWDDKSVSSTPRETRDSRQPVREESKRDGDDFRVGARVEARYRGGGKYYPGKISRVRLDGTFDVEYDDGERETHIVKHLIRVRTDGGGAVYKRAESDAYETPRETPRMQRPTPIAVKQSSFKNLVDAPSPRGRLADRIARLRQRCVQALGRSAFEEAYTYLKSHATNDDDDVLDEELDNQKAKRVRDILGHEKAHYMPLIDQLIFMEDTHSG